MATFRQIRYEQLRMLGFLHFEATQYSKIPIKSKSIQLLAKTRYADYKAAGSPPINSVKWVRQVKQEYDAKDWEWNNYVGAWRQFREYEFIWNERHPNQKDKFVSPHKKDSAKRYRELNRDFIAQQRIKYRATHKDKIAKYAKEYRLKKRLVK